MWPKIQWGGIRTKIITWSFVPTAIILIAVALVTFFAYQQVTEDLVIERNQELVRLSAGQLMTGLADNIDRLVGEARLVDIYEGDPATQREALIQARNRLTFFDGGVVILDAFGTVLTADPPRPEIMGHDWSNRSYVRQVQVAIPAGPVFSSIVPDGPDGADVIVLAVPITSPRGQFRGIMAGMFRVGATAVSAFYGDIVRLRLGESGNAYLVDGQGRVIYHSDPKRIGENFSAQEVVQAVLARQSGARRTHDPDGQDIVASFAPVPGTPWGLVTQENWSRLIQSSQKYRQFLLILLALGIVVPVLVVAIGLRQITRPITELISATQGMADGKFDPVVIPTTGDEITELAKQFNVMGAQLQELYANLEQKVAERTNELATLNTIALTASQSLELEPMLAATLDKVLEILAFESGTIHIKNRAKADLQMASHRGLSEAFRQAVDKGIVAARVGASGRPIIMDDLARRLDAPQEVLEEGYRSLASIPLLSKEQVQGVLTIASRNVRSFRQEDVTLLLSVGHQIGIAIENARLYEQAQHMATLEERQRLARELHDSVTQSLYGATLYTEATARLLAAGEVEMAKDHLGELRQTTQEALREMRLLIFELRPPILEKHGLVAALQTRLETVEGRAGIQTSFKVDKEIQLSAEIEGELYRIAQEALNNALKHAQARSVTVALHQQPGCVTLEVADDGCGFDSQIVPQQGGLGLAGMEERVTQLGGHLTVDSQVGAGTTIKVEICEWTR